MAETVRYPDAFCQLSGEDGNAMFIIARARKALKRAGASEEAIEAFTDECTGGNYDNVIGTVMRWMRIA